MSILAYALIVVELPSPTKVYQTPKLEDNPNGADSLTEPIVVPAKLEVPQGKDVALEQASLDGAATGDVELDEATQLVKVPPQLLLTYNVYVVFDDKKEVDTVVIPTPTLPLSTNPVEPLPPTPDVLISHSYPSLGAELGAVQLRFADVGDV
jgi:hypothetical protein